MKRFAGITALTLCLVAGAGCMMGDDEADWDVGASADTLAGTNSKIVMCRSIQNRLRGLEASVFRVLDHDNLLVIKKGGFVVCLDDTATVRRAGVIPVDNGKETPCSFCDGTPLPASLLIEAPE